VHLQISRSLQTLRQRWRAAPEARLLVALGLISLLTGGLGVIGYRRSEALVRQGQERAQQSLQRGLSIAVVDHLVSRDYAAIESRLRQAMADPSLAALSVRDPAGRVLVQLQRTSPGAEPRLSFEQTLAPHGDQSRQQVPLEAGGTIGLLEIRSWSTPTEQLLGRLGQQIALLTLMAVLLFVAVLTMLLLQLQRQHQRQQAELQGQNRRLADAALQDPLTGIANRRAFEWELEHRWQDLNSGRLQGLALCLLDLDGFKEINDGHGHAAGDQLLQSSAQRLRATLRDSDFLARLGGDEFVLLLVQATPHRPIESALQRLVNVISEPFEFSDLMLTARVTASVGCALVIPPSIPTEAEVLRLADQAMYAAKRSGKNRWRVVRVGAGSHPQPDPQEIVDQKCVE
jgi:diguanylate cyclase (GGDEF)-like protein